MIENLHQPYNNRLRWFLYYFFKNSHQTFSFLVVRIFKWIILIMLTRTVQVNKCVTEIQIIRICRIKKKKNVQLSVWKYYKRYLNFRLFSTYKTNRTIIKYQQFVRVIVLLVCIQRMCSRKQIGILERAFSRLFIQTIVNYGRRLTSLPMCVFDKTYVIQNG